MSKITGNQIAPKSADFGIFTEDGNGNIQLPSNIQLGGDNLATKSDVANAGGKYNGVYEKVTSQIGKYSISQTPAGNVVVYINGLAQVPTDDYSMSGKEIKFVKAPGITDVVTASYIV